MTDEFKTTTDRVDGWFEILDKAKVLGREYADNGIAGGETTPEESPLSGEFADRISPRDIVEQLSGNRNMIDNLEDFEVQDILNFWEDGYNSAPWPARDSDA